MRDIQLLMTVKGVSAYVYTEITDVEGEYNGLFTYDRRVQKVDTNQVRAAHATLINASLNLNDPAPLTLGHVRSFKVTTAGYTDRYLRHADSQARTDVITTGSADVARQDASFRTVAGLADPHCYSFESVNYPGQFLRHFAGKVRLDGNTGGAFPGDATWCGRKGLAAGGISFESKNLPGSYLRHFDGDVYVAKSGGTNAWDTAYGFTADATWDLTAPALWRSSVLLPVDLRKSLRVTTFGFGDRYVRHRDNQGYTEVVNGGSDATLKAEAGEGRGRGTGHAPHPNAGSPADQDRGGSEPDRDRGGSEPDQDRGGSEPDQDRGGRRGEWRIRVEAGRRGQCRIGTGRVAHQAAGTDSYTSWAITLS